MSLELSAALLVCAWFHEVHCLEEELHGDNSSELPNEKDVLLSLFLSWSFPAML